MCDRGENDKHMRLDRLLAITIILLNKKKITAQELAEKFEVSVRTIYRDIDAINQAGIPIVSYQGSDGGFEIMEQFKVDRHVLTLKDIRSILFALKGVNNTLENQEINNVYNKINSLVPQGNLSAFENDLEIITIDYLPWGYGSQNKEKLKKVHVAITQNRLIKFDYENTRGEKNRREVEPMTLIFKGYSWYLFGFCLLKNDSRFFRLSRIKELTINEKTFIRRNISYKDLFKEDYEQPMINLVLKFSPEVKSIVEDYNDESNIVIDNDGYLIVNVSYPDNEWIYNNLLSYGEHVEVLTPQSVRDVLKLKSQKIFEKY